MKSLFPDIITPALTECRDFYVELFGMTVLFEIDWYIQLQDPDDPDVGIAFVTPDNPSVPEALRKAPQGVIVSIETEAVDALYAKATAAGREILVDLTDEEWGQRHFVTRDPSGLPVDVFHLIPPSAEFAEKHGLPAA